MRPFLLCISLFLGILVAGCRYSPSDNPSVAGKTAPSEQFIIEDEEGEKSGTVRVDDVAGVPRLTVDVYGE